MKLEWSAIALADLDRFTTFLHERHPRLAQVIAAEIKEKAHYGFIQGRAAEPAAQITRSSTADEPLPAHQ
jgi:hypothetical protein